MPIGSTYGFLRQTEREGEKGRLACRRLFLLLLLPGTIALLSCFLLYLLFSSFSLLSSFLLFFLLFSFPSYFWHSVPLHFLRLVLFILFSPFSRSVPRLFLTVAQYVFLCPCSLPVMFAVLYFLLILPPIPALPMSLPMPSHSTPSRPIPLLFMSF